MSETMEIEEMKIEEMPELENCKLAHPTPGEEVLPDFVRVAPDKEIL